MSNFRGFYLGSERQLIYFFDHTGPFILRTRCDNTWEFCGYWIRQSPRQNMNFIAVPRGTDDVCYASSTMRGLISEIEKEYSILFNDVCEIMGK